MKDTTIHVQVMGPVDSTGAAYDWITIDAIENPPSLALDFLREHVVNMIEENKMPRINTARLLFLKNGKAYMKVVFENLQEKG